MNGAKNMSVLRQTITLNGSWQIAFDPENIGFEQGWFYPDRFAELPGVEKVEVPSCWETIREDYEGVAWYHKSFEFSEIREDANIRIHFGAVNYIADVWLNDSPVGHHEGGFTPFELDVSDVVREGTNHLIL
ncbi:MAG: hypothetical protein D6820_12950, partial [Lentisphaerae bacterium]